MNDNDNIYKFIDKYWHDPEIISEKYKNIPKEDLSDYEKGAFHFKGILGFTKDLNKAEEYISKVLPLEVNNKYIYRTLGSLYHNQHKYDKAEEYYLKVLEIDPKHTDVLYNLGFLYRYQNKYDKAEECWLKVSEIDPNYGAIVIYLKSLYEKQRKFDKMEEYLLKVLENDINNTNALNCLENYYNKQGRKFDRTYITFQIKFNKLEKRIKQLEDENKQFKDELLEYALHEAYKPDGIIAQKVKTHYEDIYKSR